MSNYGLSQPGDSRRPYTTLMTLKFYYNEPLRNRGRTDPLAHVASCEMHVCTIEAAKPEKGHSFRKGEAQSCSLTSQMGNGRVAARRRHGVVFARARFRLGLHLD